MNKEIDPKVHRQKNNKCLYCKGNPVWITPGFEGLHESFPKLHPAHECWRCGVTGLSFYLKPGRFYRAKSGDIWCCFRVNRSKPIHCVADCILTTGNSERVEYFYLDGRYDGNDNREHCLIEELPIKNIYGMELTGQ